MQINIAPREPSSNSSTDPLAGNKYVIIKRVLDVALALSLLTLLALLIVTIAVVIKLTSRGPVLYRQTRIGKGGKPFRILKFRTMRTGNDNSAHREYVQRLIREDIRPEQLGVKTLKLQKDPRITPCGRILRAVSLDELPQLFNVLAGNMSLVGPRPPLPYEYDVYSQHHKQRLNVLPGLTGLWQVYGRNLVSFEEMVNMDLSYIRGISLWLDLKILLMTPIAMFFSSGAG